jgi:UDP-N-acetyl-2-amino-2-deoxyglucuronate dehydrogenase
MKKVKCAVVGLGAIGPTHVAALAQIENAELYAVCDIVADKMQPVAEQYGCKTYNDYEALLQDPEVDLVHLCVPSGMHADLGVKAAAAGKNVLVEKPIDITLEAADRLIAACHEHGVLLSCISQHRFDPDIAWAKQEIEKGSFGRIIFGAAYTKWYRPQSYYDSGDWRGTWALDGGGALMNQSVHYVDMVQFLAGEVEEVSAYTGLLAHERIEVEDMAVAILKFKSGALGALEGTTAAYPGFHTRLDIYGTDGSFIIENDQMRICKTRAEEGEVGFYGSLAKEEDTQPKKKLTGASSAAVAATAHQSQIQDVVNAILEGRKPAITGEDARKPLAVILAVYESARTGKPVKVS